MAENVTMGCKIIEHKHHLQFMAYHICLINGIGTRPCAPLLIGRSVATPARLVLWRLEQTMTKISDRIRIKCNWHALTLTSQMLQPGMGYITPPLSPPYRHAKDLTTVSRYAGRECDVGNEAERTTNDEAICIQRRHGRAAAAL